jgi:hypothetical protein
VERSSGLPQVQWGAVDEGGLVVVEAGMLGGATGLVEDGVKLSEPCFPTALVGIVNFVCEVVGDVVEHDATPRVVMANRDMRAVRFMWRPSVVGPRALFWCWTPARQEHSATSVGQDWTSWL